MIFPHGNVQTMVQLAFDCPIAPFEFEHACGVQLIDSQTAQQINYFLTPFTIS